MRSLIFKSAMVIHVAFTAGLVTVYADREQQENLYFREDWLQVPAAIPVTQDHVNNSDLALSRHGLDADLIKKSHHDNVPNDPWYVWSGNCENGRWAISLRKNDTLVDFSSGGRLRWRTKQSGPHVLRVVLQLEDGSWLVSGKGFGETPDWHVFTTDLLQLPWRSLDIEKIVAGEIVKQPDLRRVRSVGWTDLMVGHGSKGCTRVDWIEVYGREVSEDGQRTSAGHLPLTQ